MAILPAIALFSDCFDYARLDANPSRYRDSSSTENAQAKVIVLAPFVELK